MNMLTYYDFALHDAEIARIRRTLALRGILGEGYSQAQIATRFGITQPAVSYQVAHKRTEGVRPRDLLEAGRDIVREVAEDRGFRKLGVFGSVARGEDGPESDLDFVVEPPPGANLFDLAALQEAFTRILGREVDLVTYGGLDPVLDRDILRDTELV
jgi:uncharacterized protein